MTVVAPKDARLVARVPQEVQEFVKNAADLSGATLSQFIVEAVTAKARSVYESEQNIRLSMQGAEAVFAALDNPPPVNSKLSDAAKAFNKENGFRYAGDSSAE
ncbi:type II toxin-antitoxin system TacA family antitoxin [Aliamphritea hakodatensis]|uniref:type II toxin-antitoxin system TacA family antitoxin n=1 Tax=Aliamphritea hakodatensis TaxID=2895352 RepID=UPI0035E438B0